MMGASGVRDVDEMWVKVFEFQEAARDLHEPRHGAWSEVETLDAWERLFGLQAELAVLAHEPSRAVD
jgi:hypothetical protein